MFYFTSSELTYSVLLVLGVQYIDCCDFGRDILCAISEDMVSGFLLALLPLLLLSPFSFSVFVSFLLLRSLVMRGCSAAFKSDVFLVGLIAW